MKRATTTIGRRRFLQAAGAAATLVLPFRLDAAPKAAKEAVAKPPAFEPNAFISIAPDGRITLVAHRSEMGQGIATTLAMVLCDELDAAWEQVKVVRAKGDAKYGSQNTVGDGSLLFGWEPLRNAAAAARQMLTAAAARAWSLPAKDLKTDAGHVLAPDGRKLSYGQLAAAAALETVPAKPVWKEVSAFKLIGRPTAGIDLWAQTTGTGIYGIDVQRPGMVYAVLSRAPLPTARLKSFDAKAVQALPGVLAVFPLESQVKPLAATSAAVAIVGRDSWTCLKAKRALPVDWDLGEHAGFGSAQVRALLDAAADQSGTVYRGSGDVAAARQQAKTVLKRRFRTPFLSHATLEPPVCVADVGRDRCEVWAPTQNPGEARMAIAEELRLPVSQVTVNVTMIGGGFGRKSLHDFILEAVRVSRKVGKPVKLFWTREDDLQCGYYMSPSVQDLEVGLGADGKPLFWRHHSVHSSWDATADGKPAVPELSWGELAGAVATLGFPVEHSQVSGTQVELPLRRSWMRGVQAFFHSFASNCMFDEAAAAGGHDPVALRLELLGPPRRVQQFPTRLSTDYWYDTGRMAKVIERAAALADWKAPLPAGKGRGLAVHVQSFSYIAMVAEVSTRPDGSFTVDRMVCVVDCGIVVNPDGARAQVEGSILYGLSCCLYGEISMADGRVVEGNFHDYPVARIGDTPQMTIEFVESRRTPTGLGEPCVPLVAPAVVNALASAGAGRRYELPLRGLRAA